MSSVSFEFDSERENLKAKCNRAYSILKNKHYPLLFENESDFLDLIDVNKLVYTKASELNPILDTKLFTEHEKNWIRESRRKAINRKTAAESRDRKKAEFLELKFGLTDLKDEKLALEQMQIAFLREINFYKQGLDKMARGVNPRRRAPIFTSVETYQ